MTPSNQLNQLDRLDYSTIEFENEKLKYGTKCSLGKLITGKHSTI